MITDVDSDLKIETALSYQSSASKTVIQTALFLSLKLFGFLPRMLSRSPDGLDHVFELKLRFVANGGEFIQDKTRLDTDGPNKVQV